MIEFGNTLRSAREQKGLSLEQIAETTHISRSKLEALENEQFDCFAAPIYVRGYIKLFCEEIGIDHKPLVDEFMEIYNGNREPSIKERVVTPPAAQATETATPESQAAEPESQAAEPESQAAEPESQAAEPEQQATDAAPAAPVIQQTISEGSLFPNDPVGEQPREMPAPTFSDNPVESSDADADTQSLSRYAAPIHEYDGASASRNQLLRIGLLVGVVAACCYCIFLGVRALYRATTPADAEQAKAEEVQKIDAMIKSETPPAKVATSKSVKGAPAVPAVPSNRTPTKIDPLFID